MTLWWPVTLTGPVELELVANKNRLIIESENFLSGISGNLRNRVTAYSVNVRFRPG